MATPDKWTQKLLTWLETQPAEKQARIKGMLEKGLIKEIKAELPAGWASEATSKTKAATTDKTPATTEPKTDQKTKAAAEPKSKKKTEAKTKLATETKPVDEAAKTTTEPAKKDAPAGKETNPAATTTPKETKPAKPKTKTSKAGYKIYETAKDAKEATPKGTSLERLKKMVTPAGYSPGEPIRKGLGKAARFAGKTGGVIGLYEPAMAIKDAYGKDFQDAELNRKAKRATVVYGGQAAGSILGGAAAGTFSSPIKAGVPVAVATGATVGGTAGGAIAGSVYDRFDPPPKVEKLEPSQAPVDPGRDWNEGELNKLFEADRQTEELKQRQQDAVDQVPNAILEEERQAAAAADVSSASMGPSSKPPGMYNEPPTDFQDILSPENTDENFNRILQMQKYARNNPAANLRKKRIMQAGLDAVETGTFRARRPDRYTVVV